MYIQDWKLEIQQDISSGGPKGLGVQSFNRLQWEKKQFSSLSTIYMQLYLVEE